MGAAPSVATREVSEYHVSPVISVHISSVSVSVSPRTSASLCHWHSCRKRQDLYGAILARKSSRWMSAGGDSCAASSSGTHQQNGSRQVQHKISSELDQGRCPTWEAPLPRGSIRPCRILNSQQDVAA